MVHDHVEDGYSDYETIIRMQRDIRRMTTRAAWIANGTKLIQELRADLDAAHRLVGAYQELLGVDALPPDQLVHALRGGYKHARVTIDAREVVIGLKPVPRLPDPVGEAHAWRIHVEAHQLAAGSWSVPSIARAALPRGHCYQAWRERSRALVVVVNSDCTAECARAAVRAAMVATRAG